MTWRTSLRTASFRGAKFKVSSSQTGVGRRVETFYYPTSSTTQKGQKGKKESAAPGSGNIGASRKGGTREDWIWTKDLGSEADTFVIEGYVIQTAGNQFNYMKERDKLIQALKTEGSGLLRHPFFKKDLKVSLVGKAEITEKIDSDGGIARFKMTFQQTQVPIFSQLSKAFPEFVDVSVLGMIGAVADSFTNLIDDTIAFAGSLAAPLLTCVSKVQTAVSTATGSISSLTSIATGTITNVSSTISSTVSAPSDMFSSLKEGVESVLGLVGVSGTEIINGIVNHKAKITVTGILNGESITLNGKTVPESLGVPLVRSISGSSNYAVSSTGSVPALQENNRTIVVIGSQALMLGCAARIAIRIQFTSHNEMESLMTTVTDALDSLLERLGSISDEIDDAIMFKAVTKLRSDFVTGMVGQNSGLKQKLEYTIPSDVTSSLTLAYDRFGDIARDQEIIDMNVGTIKHPGFLPNGDNVVILNV